MPAKLMKSTAVKFRKWLQDVFGCHECDYRMVKHIVARHVGSAIAVYDVSRCYCGRIRYSPEQNRLIHERWARGGQCPPIESMSLTPPRRLRIHVVETGEFLLRQPRYRQN